MDVPDMFGRTGARVPRVVFGTTALGNIYRELPEEVKFSIVAKATAESPSPVFFDCAGKYGAGLALESLGGALRRLGTPASRVVVCNKLGWYRTPLKAAEPTFEPGVWFGLRHDAELRISYEGMFECHEQGRQLLGEGHAARFLAVHDPDEFLAAARDPADRARRLEDLLGAFRALLELKQAGLAQAVGVGAKDWRVIRELAEMVDLDWVMFACSLTVYSHPPELVGFIAELHARGVGMINSAVFHSGFLIGGPWFDYRRPDPETEAGLFAWRERFLALCARHEVKPADACVRFGFAFPGIAAVALNSGKPENIPANLASASAKIPAPFWRALIDGGMVRPGLPLPA